MASADILACCCLFKILAATLALCCLAPDVAATGTMSTKPWFASAAGAALLLLGAAAFLRVTPGALAAALDHALHRRAVLRFRSPAGRRPDLDTPGRLASCRLAHLCGAAAIHGASVVTVEHEIRRPTLGVVVQPFGIAAYYGLG